MSDSEDFSRPGAFGSTPAYYDVAAVARLLDYDGCIATMRTVMQTFSQSGVDQPLRTIIPLAQGQLFAQMPGHLPGTGFGAKIISLFDDAKSPGHAAHRGVMILFDGQSGELTCIADAGELTAIRTASASAMATSVLARADARRLAIFGCGTQARTHIHALSRVRNFEAVTIWGRNPAAARIFAARMTLETGLDVTAVEDARAAAEAADVICTVTGSRTPVLLGDWVQSGTHLNIVGSSYAGPVEIDSTLVLKSRFIADSRRSVLAAGAEFLVAKDAGVIGDEHIAAEIGEVVSGAVRGRISREDVTLYKSLGHVVQDLGAIAYVHARAVDAFLTN